MPDASLTAETRATSRTRSGRHSAGSLTAVAVAPLVLPFAVAVLFGNLDAWYALAFGALSLALSPIPAAALGVFVYAAIVVAMRSLGLSEAWTYVRGLH